MSPLPLISLTLLALGAVEGLAWWWMNPSSARDNQPVPVYRPPVGLDRRAGPLVASGVGSERIEEARDQESEGRGQETEVSALQEAHAPTQIPSPTQNPKFNIQNFSPTHTLLPEIYRQAAPMLRCTSGQVFHVQIQDTASLHGAFFEWDGTDTGSVLEAFRHMPEACMGSIGMQLVSKEKPILYTVTDHSLLFDHTVFRDPGQSGNPLLPGPLVHAFRAVWVSGTREADARSGLDGRGFDQLRTIRLNSALTRYRPRNARVIQGAVRGLHTPEAAWAAFEEHMLRHLTFER